MHSSSHVLTLVTATFLTLPPTLVQPHHVLVTLLFDHEPSHPLVHSRTRSLIMSAGHSPSSSTTVEPLDASFPSPPLTTEARQSVHYPPAQRADFIVHFGHTDFHCHTFVLHIQSSYFRHVFDALTPSTSPLPPPPSLPLMADADISDGPNAVVELSPVSSPISSPSSPPQPAWRCVLSTATSYVQSALQRLTAHSERRSTRRKRDAKEEEGKEDEDEGKQDGSSTTKRQAHSAEHTVPPSSSFSSSTSPTAASTSAVCTHAGLRCVHIPPQRTVISGEAIPEADFDLFLRHLYFCAHYRFPPFLPADDLHLTASQPNISLPPYPELTEQMTSTLLRTRPPRVEGSGSVKLVWKEALLTLGQYFDCPALLARCETVGMRRLEQVRHAGAYFDVLYAHQYGMREWKRRCVELILTDRRMKQRKEYGLTALWERQLLCDMLVAANERLQSGGGGKEEKRELNRSQLLRRLEQAVARGLYE